MNEENRKTAETGKVIHYETYKPLIGMAIKKGITHPKIIALQFLEKFFLGGRLPNRSKKRKRVRGQTTWTI
jgi:hypothetical protein